jgi:hypothetical protein
MGRHLWYILTVGKLNGRNFDPVPAVNAIQSVEFRIMLACNSKSHSEYCVATPGGVEGHLFSDQC